MSEFNVIQACHSPFNHVEVWKIPPLDGDVAAPGWALSAILGATSNGNATYGQLVGCYVVREYSSTKIVYPSDFLRSYLPVHVTSSGAMIASIADSSRRFDATHYLGQLADWLERQGNLWEGPDGCGTYETEETTRMAAKLRDFIKRSEAVRSPVYGLVRPFLYLPPSKRAED